MMASTTSIDHDANERPPVALVGAFAAGALPAALSERHIAFEHYEHSDGLLRAMDEGVTFVAVFAHVDAGAARLVAALADRAASGRPPVVAVGGEVPGADAVMSDPPSRREVQTTLNLLERLAERTADLAVLRGVDQRLRAATRHDLRNPLAAVEALASALGQRELLSPEGRTDVDGLVAATRGLLQRLEALDPVPTPTDDEHRIAPTATSARALVLEAARMTGFPQAAIDWSPADADPILLVDALQFRRVLEHLLTNVRRHAQGAGTLAVRCVDEKVVVEVADSGPGLRNDGGGNGLAYCRAAVEAHGGRLAVRERHVGGTVVVAEWPGLVDLRSAHGLEPSDTAEGRPPVVWFADDEELVRKAVQRVLRHAGYVIHTFPEGQALLDALRAATDEAPDVIICDADMPGMHGLDVLRAVRDIEPQIARVLYTAYWPTNLVVDAFNEGVVHRYVNKGQSRNEIEACLSQVLEQRRAAKKAQRDPRRAHFENMIDEERLTLHVQPLFDAQTGRLVACEALLRSLHPEFRGPLDVIDASRAYSREYSLQRVLAGVAARIRRSLPADVDLFVNVDPIILRDPDQLDLAFSPLYPAADRIVLELTERAQLGSDGGWEQAVRYLRSKGFRIALDDVGAGYNSLGAVAAVTPEVIKLDISLISGIHRNPQKAELVRLLCDYAERQGIRTVAEGIEEADEARHCTEIGVRLLQGYHLGRPMPLDDLLERHCGTARRSTVPLTGLVERPESGPRLRVVEPPTDDGC